VIGLKHPLHLLGEFLENFSLRKWAKEQQKIGLAPDLNRFFFSSFFKNRDPQKFSIQNSNF